MIGCLRSKLGDKLPVGKFGSRVWQPCFELRFNDKVWNSFVFAGVVVECGMRLARRRWSRKSHTG
jgi:hypothetical protein